VIVFQDLTLWTAIAQLGLGLMAGVIVGAIVKRMTSLEPRSAYAGPHRVCPACNAPALRPVRGTAAQRVIRTITRKWPYACTRCDWPGARHAARKKPDHDSRKTPEPVVEPSVVPTEPHVRQPRAPRPKLRIIDAQTVEQTLHAEEREPEPGSPRTLLKDDAAQVKDSVYRYVASLNAGDVTARSSCSLSEFTCFDVDGGPLKCNTFEGRSQSPEGFDLRCRDLRVYVYKDTAIATAYLVGTITVASGTPTHVTGRSSWVHLRQNGEWKIAHSHLSPLSPDA
jgi:ketosteroid isomerase-like protein